MEPNTFDERDIQTLSALGTIKSVPKNTVLIQEGDRNDQIFAVLSGKLKVFLSDGEGKEIVFDILGPGQHFGEMSLDGEPRSASVMTTEPSRIAMVQQADFKRFLSEHPDAAFKLILSLIRRARNLTRTIGNLALLDVYGRIARLLLDSVKEDSGQSVVSEHMTQQEIANRVGSSRETVSRILGDLRAGGYIATDGNRIVIRQRPPKHW